MFLRCSQLFSADRQANTPPVLLWRVWTLVYVLLCITSANIFREEQPRRGIGVLNLFRSALDIIGPR